MKTKIEVKTLKINKFKILKPFKILKIKQRNQSFKNI